MAALSDLFDPRRERRSADDRQGMSLPAHVFAAGWQCHTVELVEISTRGFRAVHLDRIEPNEPIRVAIPGLGPVDARVKWVRGRHFGAEFSSPADLRLLFLGGPVAPRNTWLERRAA